MKVLYRIVSLTDMSTAARAKDVIQNLGFA
jgi:hypothetical protein